MQVRRCFSRRGVPSGHLLWPLLLLGLAGCPQTALDIEPPSLPNAVQGRSYSTVLTAADAGARVQWEITDGGLPDGLNLDSSSGEISGTPTQPGGFEFTALARESSLGGRT